MNRSFSAALLLLALGTSVPAASLVSTFDGGGRCVTGAAYRIDGSLGGIGGVSSSLSGTEVVKSGYIGQLTEATNLTVTAVPAAIDEGGVSQLGARVGLDDATTVVLGGGDVAWAAPPYPLSSIGAGGSAAAGGVYADAYASVTGLYLGVTGSGMVLVRDVLPDNYGIYAGDQIPDGWQVRYFGPDNPSGIGSATNRTGRSNLASYIADLDPTNPASIFEIVALSNAPSKRLVYFRPASTGRVYALEYGANMTSGLWTNVTPITNWGNGGVFCLSDTNTTSPRFYRVDVQVP